MNNFKVIVLALTAVCAIAAVQSESLECPTICPDLYRPTCATDGTKFVQFDNPCELKAFNCKRLRSILSTYAETDIDWCTTTELNEIDTDLAMDLEETNPQCLKACPMNYSPICGSNGTFRKVFSNECEMNMFNCLYQTKNKSNWRLLKHGFCSQNSEEQW